jgi:hypothetical protein
LGFAQAGAGVSVGVSVSVSLGVKLALGVSVGVLLGLAVGVDVLVGVFVKVSVGGTCVLVGGTVSDGISVPVAVGGNDVSEAQAEISEAVTNKTDITQKIRFFRIVDFSLNNAPKGRMELYRKSLKDVYHPDNL